MVPSRVAGGIAQSSSSGIFFQGDGQSQIAGNSHLNSNLGNSSNTTHGHARPSMGPLSGDVNNAILNSMASSAPSVGASSLVTDANSGLSGGPHLQRSASINNTESYMRLPASPLSFSSNNISISGSSVIDGSSAMHSNPDPVLQQAQQNQQHQGASSATSLPASRMGQVPLPGGSRIPSSFIHDTNTISQLQKKPRLDIKPEDILQQQALQQLLQRQDPMQLQNSNPQLQALMQQQRLRQQQQHQYQQQQHQYQQQQLLQSMPPMQRAQLLQQQQLKQQLMQHGMLPAAGVKRPYDGGVCSRRLMQYLYHQRQRPADNTINYWRKFVAEYYYPRAKKRWCLSLYDNVGQHSLGVFPQSAMDAWQCDICGSKSGKGFEATFEVLARLNEIKFGSGVIDELLFLDLPRECRFPSGMMMLEYGKAVQESVYEQLRVVREGQLRIIFTPDLKILSWEFCARRHEELLPRRLVAPQVNQLLQVAQKCQSTISESGPDGVSQPDLQANSAMVVTAGRQLARCLELQSLNDLGFSKRYVRCLQIAEVVNSMKDLMDFCKDQKVGPTEGLKKFPRNAAVPKVQMPNMEIAGGGLQGLPADGNTFNKLMAMNQGLNSPMSNNQQLQTVGRGGLNGSTPAALALTNYQNMLMRQKSMNSNHSSHQEASSPFGSPNQMPTTPASSSVLPGSIQNSPVGGCSSSPLPQQVQHHAPFLQNQSLPTQGSQALQQQIIQQLLQDMSNKNNGGAGVPQQSASIQNPGGLRGGPPLATTPGNGPGSGTGRPPSRSSSFKSTSNGDPPGPIGNVGFSQKAALDLPHLSDELVQDITHEFTEKGFFNSDLDDNMNFSWKA